MKSIKLLSAVACASLALASCVSMPSFDKQPTSITKADVDSASYALGVYFGQMIKMNNLGDLNINEIMKGCNAYLKDDSQFDSNFINERMNTFMGKRNVAVGETNLKEGEAFLAENAKKEGVVSTESGLQYKVVRPGNGNFPTSVGDEVTVNYEGTSIDGEVFDSSYEAGQAVSFTLDKVIPGWKEGILNIDEGGEIMLYIPSELAYGESGPMGPNQTLIFKVELISIQHAKNAEEIAE